MRSDIERHEKKVATAIQVALSSVRENEKQVEAKDQELDKRLNKVEARISGRLPAHSSTVSSYTIQLRLSNSMSCFVLDCSMQLL